MRALVACWALATCWMAAAACSPESLGLVPAPRSFVAGEGRFVQVVPNVPNRYDCWDFSLLDAGVAAVPVVERSDAAVPAEGYVLSVTTGGVTVTASDAGGRIYARETLRQLARVVSTNEVAFPCCEIRDSPRYRWRGVLLDEARHFLGKGVVKRMLGQMAAHKLNVLHWHLTDDQGWRVAIDRFPELVEYGAVRPRSVKFGAHATWLPPARAMAYEKDTERYGPFYYTAADVREILDSAKARNVAVVPEFDMPGHVRALLAAHPEFSCRGSALTREPRVNWSVEDDVICVGNPEAVAFVEQVFDEFCRLFPEAPYIHLGGDECPVTRWAACPKCRAKMKAENLSRPGELQAWLTARITRRLAAQGRRALGWDEVLEGGVPAETAVMFWRSSKKTAPWVPALERGHEVVLTPAAFCYIYQRQFASGDPYPYYQPWGKPLTLRKVYSFEPTDGVPAALRGGILGGQASLWGECIWNVFDLEWKTWPRTCALAEVLWSDPAQRDFASFMKRMRIHRRRLVSGGVNCAPLGDGDGHLEEEGGNEP